MDIESTGDEDEATTGAAHGGPLRALFVNENIGGHEAMHVYLRRALAEVPAVDASFIDVAPPRLARRIVGAAVPVLGDLDLDLQPLRYQLAQSALVRRALRPVVDGVDVVHVFTQNAALLSTDLLARRPTVVSIDGTNELNAYSLPYRRSSRWTRRTVDATRVFEDRVYRTATLIVSQSEWAADSLRDHYGVDPARIRVVPFGLTVGPDPERVATDLPEITFVGTSMDRKGGWRLLDVHRRRLRGRSVLNLVTRDRVPEEEGVRVFGDVRPGDGQVDAILARTAVFAFPSEIDKSSWAVVEAMAAGVPVVTANTAALPELVEHGVSGLVIDPADDDALADALVTLLDDGARREAMGRAARARVLERFDARVSTARLLDVLREAIALHG